MTETTDTTPRHSADHPPGSARPVRVLFVCLGNICRSPSGEGVLAHLAAQRGVDDLLEIDSAGTGAWHVGERADARMRRAATGRGYDLTSRARQVTAEDLDRFDLVVAMDRQNHADVACLVAGEPPEHLKLLSEFLPGGSPVDVPDPYQGGPEGFERVLDLLEAAAPAILDHLLDLADTRR